MEQTLFVKTLGNTPKVRLLDMLITGRELDYSITDIAEQAGMSRATFYSMMQSLITDKIILKTRRFGRIQLYRLNQKNYAIMRLIKFYDGLLGEETNKHLAKHQVTVP